MLRILACWELKPVEGRQLHHVEDQSLLIAHMIAHCGSPSLYKDKKCFPICHKKPALLELHQHQTPWVWWDSNTQRKAARTWAEPGGASPHSLGPCSGLWLSAGECWGQTRVGFMMISQSRRMACPPLLCPRWYIAQIQENCQVRVSAASVLIHDSDNYLLASFTTIL